MTQPLLVLHLSDFHFGPHCRFAGQDMRALGQRFCQAVEEARTDLGIAEKVGLLVVTGDIAEGGLPRQYDDALGFFESLLGALGLARRYAVLVPGNHDVCWPLCRRAENDQEIEGFDAAELERRIQATKFKPFDDFLAKLYGEDPARMADVLPLGRGAFVHAFPDRGVAVARLNSCEIESHRPADHRGVLGEAQAQALMSQWQRGDARGWLKIVSVHHNPVATVPAGVASWVAYLRAQMQAGTIKPEQIEHFAADAVGFEGRERLRAIAEDCRVQLVLHGHHHASAKEAWTWQRAKGQTNVLSAGSWGLRPERLPEGQPIVMQLVRLDAAREEMRAVLRVYEPRARAEGAVTPGHFTTDAANPDGCTLHMSPPDGHGLSRLPETAPIEDESSAVNDFIREYRLRLKSRYARWELGSVGAVQPGGAGRPVDAALDGMYLPLRLGKDFDIRKLDQGTVVSPEVLLTRKAPLVIRGAAGSGKTTWMQWTFRRLVEMESVLPFMIELRQLASMWGKPDLRGVARTFDAYLRDWVAESGAGGWQDALPRVLASKTGPRPVLLVDGWDELGALGEELRGKLTGFLAAHDRVLAVVTSRPYGDGRPSHSEGFETLDIQPLSNEEIATFTGRFFRQVHGEDEHAARGSMVRFLVALKGSPDAESLGRTALFLTMMLLISRDRPLPDKRHKLYEDCLRNLLSARPDQREREGAQRLHAQWRPDDSDERMRVVAEMAFRMQDEGYSQTTRAPIVRAWEELVTLLPEAWKREERSGFLQWLVCAAGVMVDRADGKLSFAHLSFQEYLVASHLEATKEGVEERKAIYRERLSYLNWWETLRLLGALVEARNPDHLRPLLDWLIAGDPAGYWLASAMFADGLGTTAAFECSVKWLANRFHVGEARWSSMAAHAWAASRQHERRAHLCAALQDSLASWTWLGALLAAEWQVAARLEEVGPESLTSTFARSAFDVLIEQIGNEKGVGLSRSLGGSSPVWPGEPVELVLLQLWPNHRVHAGARLQTLLSLGGNVEDMRAASRCILLPADEKLDLARNLARDLAWGLGRDWARDLAWDWVRDLARDLAQDYTQHLARSWARHLVRDWAQYLALYLVPNLTRDLVRDWARDLVRDWARYLAHYLALYLVQDLARDWARYLALPPEASWIIDAAAVEVGSAFGRAGTRALLALSNPEGNSLGTLFHCACRASLRPQNDPEPLRAALAALPQDTDPLWPALARHLARTSTAEDRALLDDLAQHPEKREPPLSWGLRYYVRGDVVLSADADITLDALCDEAGLPRLPYLEDMPDELELDADIEAPTAKD